MTDFTPLCLNNTIGRALVNNGYILPCCFMDYAFRFRKDSLPLVFQNLVDEELNISNVDSIEDLFESKQWKAFLQYMQDASDKKTDCKVIECTRYCTKNYDPDPTAIRIADNE